MNTVVVRPGGPLRGRTRVPGDKSISHRALVFNALAGGRATIRGLLDSEDVEATRRCLVALGTDISRRPDGTVVVNGRALRFDEPSEVLDCGNSGTTMRLLCGLLAGQGFHAVLTGDASLRGRPMGRVTGPLVGFGATIDGASQGTRAPLSVRGGALINGAVTSRIASAQVRTSLLLAGLQGTGRLEIRQPALGRDHSERMLAAMGVPLWVEADARGALVTLDGPQVPAATDIDVPGDLSSAAFLAVAALLVSGSSLTIEGVGLNPGRTGILDVLGRMGAEVAVVHGDMRSGEPVGDLAIRHSPLRGVDIGADEVPRLIDEVPVLAVAAAVADGTTVISGASELRHKESDRIATTVAMIRAFGGSAEERPDGMVIVGRPGSLRGTHFAAGSDHRLAMAATVAGLVATGETTVQDAQAMRTSFPNFPSLLEQLRG